MNRILCLNKIAKIGTDRFGPNYEFSTEMTDYTGILVRSASMHDMELPETLLSIARAGAGVNNIPIEACTKQGIVVFNTPGANANAVKELVIAALLLSSRKITASMDWVKTLKGSGSEVGKLVEKGKGAFTGPEIQGKTLGVVGLGAIGILVANACQRLGMKVYGYDPYLSLKSAWNLSSSIQYAASLDDIYANCDYITLHLPATPDTKGMISAQSIAKMKEQVRLLNFARGELVDSAALLEGLSAGKVACYATDFPTDDLLGVENVVAIPHLGASTPESEDNCAEMAVDEIKDYLENGNITNSVNLPALTMAREPGTTRLCLIHKNLPNTIAAFTTACGESGMNIENMLSKAKGEYAYTILDVSGPVTPQAISPLDSLQAVIRVRVIQ